MATEDKTETKKLPIHFRFANDLERIATRIVQRKSGSFNKLRQRLDDWAQSETDPALKMRIVEMASEVDEASETLKGIAATLKSLPEDYSKKPAQPRKAKIEVKDLCKVKDTHVDKYEGILKATEGLKVTSLRKTHVAVDVDGENFVMPKSHLEVQEKASNASA